MKREDVEESSGDLFQGTAALFPLGYRVKPRNYCQVSQYLGRDTNRVHRKYEAQALTTTPEYDSLYNIKY
jgi:hypothetical protein